MDEIELKSHTQIFRDHADVLERLVRAEKAAQLFEQSNQGLTSYILRIKSVVDNEKKLSKKDMVDQLKELISDLTE